MRPATLPLRCMRDVSADAIGAQCPVCFHSGLMHKPFSGADGCVVCALDQLVAHLNMLGRQLALAHDLISKLNTTIETMKAGFEKDRR